MRTIIKNNQVILVARDTGDRRGPVGTLRQGYPLVGCPALPGVRLPKTSPLTFVRKGVQPGPDSRGRGLRTTSQRPWRSGSSARLARTPPEVRSQHAGARPPASHVCLEGCSTGPARTPSGGPVPPRGGLTPSGHTCSGQPRGSGPPIPPGRGPDPPRGAQEATARPALPRGL